LVHVAEALTSGRYVDVLRLLIEHNGSVMRARGGAAAWIRIEKEKLDVRFRDESVALEPPDQLAAPWSNTYFLNSLTGPRDPRGRLFQHPARSPVRRFRAHERAPPQGGGLLLYRLGSSGRRCCRCSWTCAQSGDRCDHFSWRKRWDSIDAIAVYYDRLR
jgi:hypothetical protein